MSNEQYVLFFGGLKVKYHWRLDKNLYFPLIYGSGNSATLLKIPNKE